MSKINEMFDGWVNGVFDPNMSPERQALTTERLNICRECEFCKPSYVMNTIQKLIDGVWKEESRTIDKDKFMGYQCTLCHCQTYAKAATPLSVCPGNTDPTQGSLFEPKWTGRGDIT